jgi:hypothetical protein
MSNVKLPKGQDLASEYARTLTAQANIMPSLLAAQSQFQPLQASNQLSNLDMMLNGTEGGTYNTQSYVPAVYKQGGKYSYGKIPTGVDGTIDYPSLPDPRGGGGGGSGGSGIPGLGSGTGMPGLPGMDGGVLPGMNGIPGLGGGGGGNPLSGIPGLGGLFGGSSGPKKKLVSNSYYKTSAHSYGPQRGLLDIYNHDVLPQMSGGIIPKLTDEANYELSLGGNMDPAQLRRTMQAIRGQNNGMLGGTGSAGEFQTALGLSQYSDALRQQRQGFAGNVAAMRMGANPVSQAMGLSAAPGATSLLNPESGYAQNLYDNNQSMLVNGAIANANNKNALIGAGISAVGSLAGGAMSMI